MKRPASVYCAIGCGLVAVLVVVVAVVRAQAYARHDALQGAPLIVPAIPGEISELLGKLDALKSKQDALEQQRREMVAVLREKLRSHKAHLARHGVTITLPDEQPAAAPPLPATLTDVTPAPTISR